MTKEYFRCLIRDTLQGRKFIVVSHDEPYVHRRAGGHVECIEHATGVTGMIDPILRACGGTWIAYGGGNADRGAVDQRDRTVVPRGDTRYTLRRVWLDKQREERYYNGLAYHGLWPLCHTVFTRPLFRSEEWQAYREVNEIFARAVLEEAGGEPAFVFVQDFHLALLPGLLRERNPNITVALFWRIPWPSADTIRVFPWKEDLISGLLGSEVMAFQTAGSCRNFLDAAERFTGAAVDRERLRVRRADHSTAVLHSPASIDFEEIAGWAAGETHQEETERWRHELHLDGVKVGLAIDRLDYTRGIPERLRAVDRLLEEYPQYRERLVFVQVAAPGGVRTRDHKLLEMEVDRLVHRINGKYRKWPVSSWRPIILMHDRLPRRQSAALYRLADFYLAGSLDEGMNLGAKAYVAGCRENDGVLVLSEFAGAAVELRDAVCFNPFSETDSVEALRQAMEMSPPERRMRMLKMRAVLEENNIYRWAGKIASALPELNFTREEARVAATDGLST